jgi:hypothetical protein
MRHQIADTANRICDLQQIGHEIAHEIARVTSPLLTALHTYSITTHIGSPLATVAGCSAPRRRCTCLGRRE